MSDMRHLDTALQRELLTMLAEEAGEVVQACTKALRHGLQNHHPESSDTNLTNLNDELRDLYAVVTMLNEHGVDVGGFSPYGLRARARIKQEYMREISKINA